MYPDVAKLKIASVVVAYSNFCLKRALENTHNINMALHFKKKRKEQCFHLNDLFI